MKFDLISAANCRLQTVSWIQNIKTIKFFVKFDKRAATWQNQQNDCAPGNDSDQPGHSPSLIRVFADRMKKAWVLCYPLSAQRRFWSDWADDLSLRWAHNHFAGFVMSRLINLGRRVKVLFLVRIMHVFAAYLWVLMAVCPRHDKWAASWQNQHNDCAPSEDSDQPGHPPNLIRASAVRSVGS